MAFKPGYKARILLGDFSLSPKLNQISLPTTVDMLDVTTFADNGVKRFIPGVDTSTASMSGFIDAETATDSAAWTAAQPLTYGPQGLTIGDPVFMVDTLRSSYELGSQVSGVASFDLAAQTDAFTDLGVSLHDLGAETATSNSTSYDQTVASTTAGGVGHLHVTAFSGLTNIVIRIADSADNSSFATIGTFATVTGLTSERLAIAGTIRRYVRAAWTVTGTGSCTFAVAFSRN